MPCLLLDGLYHGIVSRIPRGFNVLSQWSCMGFQLEYTAWISRSCEMITHPGKVALVNDSRLHRLGPFTVCGPPTVGANGFRLTIGYSWKIYVEAGYPGPNS